MELGGGCGTRGRVVAACWLAAALLALPGAARAQTRTLQDQALREPAAIAVPGASLAGAEEPTALEVNPAGAGFVDGLTLQYFHEGRAASGRSGDGVWLAAPLGPLVPTLAMQWIRPGDAGGPRFRKTTLGLALAGGQTLSVGVAGNWYASPDGALDRLWTLDAGVTVRPWRALSVGAAIRGINGWIGDRRLPVRYDVGVATRLWRDRLTLSADLLADDRDRDGLTLAAAALGVGAEIAGGVALQAQVQVPVRSGPGGPAGSSYAQLALTFNTPHLGVTAAGGSGDGATRTWLLGARLSTQRYLAAARPSAPLVDLSRALTRSRSLLFPGDPDRYGALLRRLVEIRDDPSARAVAVKIEELPLGHGRIEELRRLLLEVKARKPVAAYLTGGGMKEYYLASAASVVLSPPSAELFPAGLSSSSYFVKRTLEKVGVAFDVVAMGAYKSAPDPLVREDMSEAQREVATSLLDDLFARQVRGISEARGLTPARVRELVETGVFSAEQAAAARLIDGTAWPDELDEQVARLLGHEVPLRAGWDRAPPRAAQRWGPRRAVGVVRVEGTIARGRSRSDPFGAVGIAGADTVAELLRRAAADRDVAAIVLRIESPGGDGLASDLVWRAVMQARRAGKPVIASMGDVAASGGYLAAVAADTLIAEPSTLTGSIGVFALKPDLSGLLAGIGVRRVTLRRGEHADLRSFTRPWTLEERSLVEGQVKAFYDVFLARVASGRRMTTDQVHPLAQGRVWTGAQALERGLVDRVGSFADAVELAKERAGLAGDDSVELRAFEPDRSFLRELAGGLAAEETPSVVAMLASIPELRTAALLLELGPLLALPPEWVGVEVPPTAGPVPGGAAPGDGAR